jgi:hypothetical protein
MPCSNRLTVNESADERWEEMPDVGKLEQTPDALIASIMRQGAPVGLLQQ